MNIGTIALKNDEKAIFALRSFYRRYGDSQYKMNKFEEYDLYVRNKDFLISDGILTFTDTNGKLMALKPDVTLSIIKNSKDLTDSVQNVYYNENVYRVSKGTHSFKEIMQVGLECLGAVDDYCIYEVLMLAAESLKSISADCVLDISHLGIISAVIDGLGLSAEDKNAVLKCISEKNIHEIAAICSRAQADPVLTEKLRQLVSTYGAPREVLPRIRELMGDLLPAEGMDQLQTLVDLLGHAGYQEMLRIDFSVIDNMNYYNGIVFKGFVNGVPSGILSGGQYDKLMKKMGHKASAIGFAVYLDLLERMTGSENRFDVDNVILYDETSDLQVLNDTIKLLMANGNSVMAQKSVPEKLKYKQLLRLQERGVEIIETHA